MANDAALASFATRGYEASSLDALAAGLEVRKQTILYWFPSKEVLLEAVIDRSAIELSNALEESLAAGVPNRLISRTRPSSSGRRASEFLEAEMDAGHMRRHEPRLLLLAIYSTVIGMLTEVEVLRAFGEEPTARSLVRRRTEILQLLRTALVTEPG